MNICNNEDCEDLLQQLTDDAMVDLEQINRLEDENAALATANDSLQTIVDRLTQECVRLTEFNTKSKAQLIETERISQNREQTILQLQDQRAVTEAKLDKFMRSQAGKLANPKYSQLEADINAIPNENLLNADVCVESHFPQDTYRQVIDVRVEFEPLSFFSGKTDDALISQAIEDILYRVEDELVAHLQRGNKKIRRTKNYGVMQ